MVTALSGVSLNSVLPSTGYESTTANAAAATRKGPTPQSDADTVKLSVTQQVRSLRAEGEGAGQIATSLGLTVGQVNNDSYVSLTWPQLLSKVASASLTLGSTTPEAASVTNAASSATTHNAAASGKLDGKAPAKLAEDPALQQPAVPVSATTE